MGAINAVILAIGIAIVIIALSDVFQSVIVPRAVGRVRPTSYLWRFSWRLWPQVAWRIYPRDETRREDFLAMYAPFMIVAMLGFWVTQLTIGYGSIFWALRSDFPTMKSYGAALYFAGTTMLTIGFGDIAPHGMWARFSSVVAGASGLGVVSVTTAFLFSVFAAFQAREQFVVKTGARAGSPPSGVGLLAIASYAQVPGELNALMSEAQGWAATVMETHLAYPALAYFRSSHDSESWVATLGALLDAAVLLITTIDMPCGQARIFYSIGRHAATDLANFFNVDGADRVVGVERDEFDRACERLRNAGYTLHDPELAWKHFCELRATYAVHLNALARKFEAPPAQWIGDRSLVSAHLLDRV